VISSVVRGEGGYSPPIGPKKKRNKEKIALSAYLRGLFAAIGSLMAFKAILQALEEGGDKIYRCYTKFQDFYSEISRFQDWVV